MGLRFLSLLFLLFAVAYAAPTFEDEVEDPTPMEEIEDVMEDDDDDMEDPMEGLEEDEEEDPKKKKKKYYGLFGSFAYCACKKPAKKGDVEEDISDHIDKITEDVELSDPAKSKKKFNFKKYLKKLVSPYFHAVNLKCYCTVNKPVVRLLRYLKIASVIGRRQKVAFWRRVRALVSAVKKQKSKSG